MLYAHISCTLRTMLYYLRIRMTIYVAVLKNRNNFLYMYVFLNCAMNFLVPTKIMGVKYTSSHIEN